jgi:hypothetical protein
VLQSVGDEDQCKADHESQYRQAMSERANNMLVSSVSQYLRGRAGGVLLVLPDAVCYLMRLSILPVLFALIGRRGVQRQYVYA